MTSHQESVSEASDVAEFLSKLEAACGCDVPDSLKASLLNVNEEHCKGCLPCCRRNMVGSPPRGVPVVVDYR